jgi:hypothetical protein
MAGNMRDLALFNMAVDSKLRGCDLVALRVHEVFAAGQVKERASIEQDRAPRQVRDHGDHPAVARAMDRQSQDARRRVSLAEPNP